MIVLYTVLSVILLYILVCTVLIVFSSKRSRDIPAGTPAIVLGYKLNGNQPDPILKQRCDAAREYLESDGNAHLILSGGKGKDGEISEAQAMFDYLVSNGVSPERLIREEKSTTTKENMIFSKRLLEERFDTCRAVIITTDFHQLRSKCLAKRAGIIPYTVSSPTDASSEIKNILREAAVIPGLLKK